MLQVYLVVLVLLTALCVALFVYADNYDNPASFVAGYLGVLLTLATVVACFVSIPMAFSWLASAEKAKIINREYGTNYTQREIFYASDVIGTIREISRRRVEVNGDLFRDQADDHPDRRKADK